MKSEPSLAVKILIPATQEAEAVWAIQGDPHLPVKEH